LIGGEFLRLLGSTSNVCTTTRTITLDGYAASHRAVRELKADGLLPAETKAAVVEVLEQSDRAGPSGCETANRHDAGLQGLRDPRRLRSPVSN
jgi:hypothetical protein